MAIKLGVDIDNICVNTTESLVEYINERVPVNLKMSDITTYYIENALPDQYKWIVASGFRDRDMWKKVKLLQDCDVALNMLYDQGYEIYFVTSSLPENLRKKINHLSRNMQFFPNDYIFQNTINIQDKSLLNLDIHIDDCLAHALNPNRKYASIVLDYPWNKTEGGIPCFARAYDWRGIYEAVHMFTDLIKESRNDNV